MPKDDVFSWMWPEACTMLARAEQLHRHFFHVRAGTARQPVWEPPVDVIETRTHLLVLVALPGVDPATVSAAIEGDRLVVVGERALPDELANAHIHRMELPHGRFERSVPLPGGRYTDVRRDAAYGCLIITLSKIH